MNFGSFLPTYLPYQNTAEEQNQVRTVVTVNGTRPEVEKEIKIGPGGGLYYENSAGKKVYLKNYQRRKCEDNTLLYTTGDVCGVVSRPPAQGRRPYGKYRRDDDA